MGGKLALVVGSECAALPSLGFPGELAGELYSALSGAGWRSAIDHDGPMLSPTIAEFIGALNQAFAAASDQQATLLISFVGHGTALGTDDFYLLALDSPSTPDSSIAFHLAQGIREKLNRFSPDGLIVVIDACETEQGVIGSARRWVDVLAHSSGRVELLVASGDGPAYSGCFTRTMVSTFSSGLAASGEYLLPADLTGPIAAACTRQQPRHLSFSAGDAATFGDPGLWLVPNAARRDDAVTGRPIAGSVDQLTRGLVLTDGLREQLSAVVETSGRLRAVVGPAGCGKSTLMALLVRPSLADNLEDLSSRYITAAVFLDVTATIESFATELSAQLRHRLSDYDAAIDAVERDLISRGDVELGLFDRTVREPLARLTKPGRRITLIVDGLDQPAAGSRELLVAAVSMLTRRSDLAHVRVIAGIRSGTGLEDAPELGHMRRINLKPPAAHDIAAAVKINWDGDQSTGWAAAFNRLVHELDAQDLAGGWLLARLLTEIDQSTSDSNILETVDLDALVRERLNCAAIDSGIHATTLAILVASGEGPALPLELLRSALASQGIALSHTQIRDIAVRLGALVIRGRSGTPQEALGIAHSALIPPLTAALNELGIDLEEPHRSIAAAIETSTDEQVADYARGSAVRHYLSFGNSAGAVSYLTALNSTRAADNRDQWASWIPTFIDVVGPDRADTLAARGHLAWWRGESGDVSTAIAEFEQLEADLRRVMGPDAPETLSARESLAHWHGDHGDTATAISELEQLLADRRRVLGVDHPDTLQTAHNLAWWRGEIGDVAGAITDYERILPARLHILGPDHPDTLRTRNNLAHWRGENGDLNGAIVEYEHVLADRQRVLGPEHPDTLQTAHNLANRRGENGDLITAITEYKQILTDRSRVLGPDHPNTLRTRNTLAQWLGENGDIDSAIIEYEQLLSDRQRILGSDHPDTLTTRNNMSYWRGRKANATSAVVELEQLLDDNIRALGPDHPLTLITRSNLAHWRGEQGNFTTAAAEYEQLLIDRLRVLGPAHPDSHRTRRNAAYWRSRHDDGDAVSTVEPQQHPGRLDVLGSDHP